MVQIDDARSFGAALRAARRAAGLSQQDLADRARVARRTVASVEGGHPNGEVSTFLALVRALGLQVRLVPAEDPAFSLDSIEQDTAPL